MPVSAPTRSSYGYSVRDIEPALNVRSPLRAPREYAKSAVTEVPVRRLAKRDWAKAVDAVRSLARNGDTDLALMLLRSREYQHILHSYGNPSHYKGYLNSLVGQAGPSLAIVLSTTDSLAAASCCGLTNRSLRN